MASLSDYVLKLARNPEEARKFGKSKDAAKEHMRAAGLSDEHQMLLLSGDPEAIGNAIKNEFAGNAGLGAGEAFISTSISTTLSLTIPKPQ